MNKDLELDPFEARVLGVLIEKALTTPDLYPLTLNSVTLGANQKSNRDPMMELLEGDAYAALQKLIRKGFVGSVHPLGARVEKFRHNTEAVLKIETPHAAVLAELLMRGPQQPGELRARASRMSPIDSLQSLLEILKPMIESGLVMRVEPGGGSRAERFAQRLAPTAHRIDLKPEPVRPPAAAAASIASSTPGAASVTAAMPLSSARAATARTPDANTETLEKRVVELESSVSRLRRQLDNLAWKLGEKLEG